MSNKKLLIYGAGGLGREIYDLASRNNGARWDGIYFLDDYCNGRRQLFETEVMTPNEALDLWPAKELECVIAVGEPALRERLFNKLLQLGLRPTTLIDRTSIVSETVQVGEGTIICEFVTVHTGVRIGKNTLIQPQAVLGHDIEVGNHVVLSAFCAPGGACKFGDRAFVGMQATIIEELTIGDDAVVSMGAAVFRDVDPGTTVVGNPARVTKGNAEHQIYKS